MLLALALLAQATPLNAEATAALECRSALITLHEETPMMGAAITSYYTMEAAKADSGGKPFLDRTIELIGRDAPPVGPADAARVLAACDARFPLARRAGPATLPADSFDRDVVCLGAVGMMLGAAGADTAATGDATEEKRLQAVMRAYDARLSQPVLDSHGLKSADAFQLALGTHLMASLELGNLDVLVRACTASV